MPSRTAPLRRGAPLARTALTGGPAPIRATPLRRTPPVAAPARDRGPTRRTRLLVYARAGATDGWPGGCEWPGCTRPRTDVHHRLNRKAGGRHGQMRARLNRAAWLLACCRHHHRQVTSAHGDELAAARAAGWLLVEGQDAAVVPVLTRHHQGPVLLDDAGGWTPFRVD
jgi:hypothetical protein